jgi:hypothetical protein
MEEVHVDEREMKGTDEESEEREQRTTAEPDVEGHKFDTGAPGQHSRDEPQEQHSRE